MTTLTACAHCGAILDGSSFCAICQKSPLEPVDEVAEPERPAKQPRRSLSTPKAIAGIIAALVLIWAWTRPDGAATVAPRLPTPTTLDPSFASEETAPSVADAPVAVTPTDSLAVGAGTPGDAPAPWDSPPPVAVDHATGRAHVAALLAAVPEPWSIGLRTPTAADQLGLELGTTEATRPFAARTLAHAELGPIGQFWIISAAPDDPAGTAFVEIARSRLDDAVVVETVDGGPGLELVRIDTGRDGVWVARYDVATQVAFFAARDIDPSVLLAFLDDWRLADLPVS